MTSTPERRDEIGAFYAANTNRLQRAVRRRVAYVSDATIEDACHTAWAILLRRPDVDLRGTGFAWLTTVAIHEAQRLDSIRNEIPGGAFVTVGQFAQDPGAMPEPMDDDPRGTDEKALARVEHAARKEAIALLKPREREALYLKGLGYTYEEIARLTDSTYTAVNRRITEGRAALRRHLPEESAPSRWERTSADSSSTGGESGAGAA